MKKSRVSFNYYTFINSIRFKWKIIKWIDRHKNVLITTTTTREKLRKYLITTFYSVNYDLIKTILPAYTYIIPMSFDRSRNTINDTF